MTDVPVIGRRRTYDALFFSLHVVSYHIPWHIAYWHYNTCISGYTHYFIYLKTRNNSDECLWTGLTFHAQVNMIQPESRVTRVGFGDTFGCVYGIGDSFHVLKLDNCELLWPSWFMMLLLCYHITDYLLVYSNYSLWYWPSRSVIY